MAGSPAAYGGVTIGAGGTAQASSVYGCASPSAYGWWVSACGPSTSTGQYVNASLAVFDEGATTDVRVHWDISSDCGGYGYADECLSGSADWQLTAWITESGRNVTQDWAY